MLELQKFKIPKRLMRIGPIMLGSAIIFPQITISEIISYLFYVPTHSHPHKRAPLTEVLYSRIQSPCSEWTIKTHAFSVHNRVSCSLSWPTSTDALKFSNYPRNFVNTHWPCLESITFLEIRGHIQQSMSHFLTELLLLTYSFSILSISFCF